MEKSTENSCDEDFCMDMRVIKGKCPDYELSLSDMENLEDPWKKICRLEGIPENFVRIEWVSVKPPDSVRYQIN